VKATRAFGVLLNGAAGALDTPRSTRRATGSALYRTNCHVESVSGTCTIACRARRDSEVIDGPAHNHLGRNLD